jgi:hypothetical protein
MKYSKFVLCYLDLMGNTYVDNITIPVHKMMS